MSSTLRSMRRDIVRHGIEAAGIRKSCKHSYTRGAKVFGKGTETTRHDSYFAEKWQEIAESIFKKKKEVEV